MPHYSRLILYMFDYNISFALVIISLCLPFLDFTLLYFPFGDSPLCASSSFAGMFLCRCSFCSAPSPRSSSSCVDSVNKSNLRPVSLLGYPIVLGCS